jgi:uncharacterized protein
MDDLKDYRPGLKAGREYGIRNPMVEAGLTKTDIRHLSREMGLPTWDKPAQPCLSSRIPFGALVSVEALVRIGQAEELLKNMGFQGCRVRHHDTIARIEIDPEDMDKIINQDIREGIVSGLRNLGYLYVTLDLLGYRMGSLNAMLKS